MKYLMLIAAISVTGCFGAQHDSINQEADNRMHALDVQCKENMTDWCISQYILIQRQRENELKDLEVRRQAFSDAMSQVGKGMQRNQQQTHCTTQVIGNYAYTDCN